MASRNIEKVGTKGSLAWMQVLVNRYPEMLNAAVGNVTGIDPAVIDWVSPLADDDFAEYRDQGFLERLGIELTRHSLSAFWPSLGPQWDALARTRSSVILLEAKAHLNELKSTCAAGEASMAKIHNSFNLVKVGVGAARDSVWTTPFYQYANRLAHLYLLRELNDIDAKLVMLCFLNDREMRGPETEAQWSQEISKVHDTLGIRYLPICEHIQHVFIDVRNLA